MNDRCLIDRFLIYYPVKILGAGQFEGWGAGSPNPMIHPRHGLLEKSQSTWAIFPAKPPWLGHEVSFARPG